MAKTAQDWIKMKRGLRVAPKVVAMARSLIDTPGFLESCITPPRHVTECVTFAFVTRVTVAGLLDVWSSLNHSLKPDGKAPYMNLADVDAIAEIPGFGEAMRKVGWCAVLASGGLVFPNFCKNNTPISDRNGVAKTPAQRAKEYRDRKRNQTTVGEAPEPSRHVTREEIREEIVIESTTPGREFPDLPSVKSYAASAPVPIADECAVAFFDSQEAAGWITRHGHPIADWRAALRRYSSHWNENEKIRRASSKAPHREQKTASEYPETRRPLPRL